MLAARLPVRAKGSKKSVKRNLFVAWESKEAATATVRYTWLNVARRRSIFIRDAADPSCLSLCDGMSRGASLVVVIGGDAELGLSVAGCFIHFVKAVGADSEWTYDVAPSGWFMTLVPEAVALLSAAHVEIHSAVHRSLKRTPQPPLEAGDVKRDFDDLVGLGESIPSSNCRLRRCTSCSASESPLRAAVNRCPQNCGKRSQRGRSSWQRRTERCLICRRVSLAIRSDTPGDMASRTLAVGSDRAICHAVRIASCMSSSACLAGSIGVGPLSVGMDPTWSASAHHSSRCSWISIKRKGSCAARCLAATLRSIHRSRWRVRTFDGERARSVSATAASISRNRSLSPRTSSRQAAPPQRGGAVLCSDWNLWWSLDRCAMYRCLSSMSHFLWRNSNGFGDVSRKIQS